MNIQTTANNLDLTPDIQSYLQKRLAVLDKFLKEDKETNAHVILSKESNHHRNGDIFSAEITMHVKGKPMFAKSEQESLFAAIDIMKDEIARSLKQNKNKKDTLIRKGGRKVKAMLRGLRF